MTQLSLMILILAVDVFMLLPIMIVITETKVYKFKHRKSISYVKYVLGYLISLNGEIRVGKTSFMSGLSSLIQYIIIDLIQELKRKVKTIFRYIDFNDLNTYLDQKIDENPFYDIDKLTDEVIERFQISGDDLHFNLIGQKKNKKLMHDYIEVYWIEMVRNNYVQSKTPFYSHITAAYSMILDMDWMKIKNAYSKKSYSIYKYMVLLADEVTDEIPADGYLKDMQDQSGNKEFRRKFGQLFEETSWFITTKQDILDEVKKYRNLTQSNLIVEEKVKQIGYKWLEKLIVSFYSSYLSTYRVMKIWPRFFYQFLRHPIKSIFKKEKLTFDELEEIKFNQVSTYRSRENFIYYIHQFFTSIRFNKYLTVKLRKAEDIEKITADRESFSFIIPTVDCFGTYDTHYYRFIQDELLKQSHTETSESNPFIKKSYFKTSSNVKGDDNFDF
ncbi:MAG: hypothetical protein AB7E61_06100 [Acholeplasmataceae bacterium]